MYRTPFLVGRMAAYAADSGADVAMPLRSPIIAVATGHVIYCEGWGPGQRVHTPWIRDHDHPQDTPGALLLQLASPIYWDNVAWLYAWYCHLSAGFALIRDGIDSPRLVDMGMMIGRSGVGNNSPHEHFGLLTDRSQAPGTYMAPFRVQAWIEACTVQHNA